MKEKHKDIKDLCLAINILSGVQFLPLYDSQNKVIGTKAVMLSQSDFGGSLAKWIVQKFTPKGLHEFFDEIVKYVKEMPLTSDNQN